MAERPTRDPAIEHAPEVTSQRPSADPPYDAREEPDRQAGPVRGMQFNLAWGLVVLSVPVVIVTVLVFGPLALVSIPLLVILIWALARGRAT